MIDEIKNCNKCGLREKVPCFFEKKDLDSYLKFSFYYSEKDADNAKFLMIMQNPGATKDWVNDQELISLKEVNNKQEFLEVNRNALINWLIDKNNFFLKNFVNSLIKYGLLDYSFGPEKSDNNSKNFINNFMRDFIFTDVVKCRITTEDISNKAKITCFDNYLNNELKKFGREKLIFAFSSRTWDLLYEKFIEDKPINTEDNKITRAHGKLFFSKYLNSYIIPLAHFSQRQFNSYLRDSYFDYLEEGLQAYKKTISI